MRLLNKGIGAKVLVKNVLVEISPKYKKWKVARNVPGRIVSREGLKNYYCTSTGANTYPVQHFFEGWDSDIAVKFDNDFKDIAGDNIVRLHQYEVKFLQYLSKKVKVVSKKEYNKAVKTVEKYNYQQTLKQ